MSDLDPRTPVLVGAGVVQQKNDDAKAAKEAVALMIEACSKAADDAGSRALLTDANRYIATKGFWPYTDPCRIVRDHFGASKAKTVLADLGILQTSPFARAAIEILAGESDIVVITGGEAKYRTLRAQISGEEIVDTDQGGAEPDELIKPAQDIIHALEIDFGIAMPVNQYAMIDSALRYEQGQTVDEHRDEVAKLWSDFSRVASNNPNAWSREAVSADEIRDPLNRNKMLAFPYTKFHTSQWNVDQAAAFILCSVERARELGISKDKWVFPVAIAENNHMLSLVERENPERSPGFAHGLRAVLDSIGKSPSDIDHFELYSCFPAAVRVQAREMALSDEHQWTQTGGMRFAGGPLNNFVFQALAKMVDVLRKSPGDLGLVTAVSGMITKQGVSLWSTQAPAGGFSFHDVSTEVKNDTRRLNVSSDINGETTVVTYTVLFENNQPKTAVLLCETDDSTRTLASTNDDARVAAMCRKEFCGRRVRVDNRKLDELL